MRLYNVLYYRYIEGQSCREVMNRLAIGRTTLYYEQERAIAAVCDFLRERERDLRPPPISPRPVPRIESFVGRQEELVAHRRQLEQEHFVAIVGLPGVGKTSLGAELAAGWEAEGQPVVWITFREGHNTDLESLLETIALSLAAQGEDASWCFMQAERRKEVPLATESRVHYLLTVLEGGGYTLCLDNFQLVNENRAISSLCADLLRGAGGRKPALSQSPERSAGAAEGVRLLVMSRVTPRFARGRLSRPLRGLRREDARRLLAVTGLSALPEALFAVLYARTSGIPIFLRLFAAWVHSQELERMENEGARERVASFVENMIKNQDVRSYLLHEVYETLGPQERRFLTCASVFRTAFDTKEAPIVALLAAEGVQDIEGVWTSLASRHIFTHPEEQEAISLHPLLREYFGRRLRTSPGERVRIHRRVAAYYEEYVGDVLEAGYHYFEAGDAYAERAAKLLSENVTRLIDAGQAQAALEQLERLVPHRAHAAGAELRFEVAAAWEQVEKNAGRHDACAVASDGVVQIDDVAPPVVVLAGAQARSAGDVA